MENYEINVVFYYLYVLKADIIRQNSSLPDVSYLIFITL